jgi:hypothetical protein
MIVKKKELYEIYINIYELIMEFTYNKNKKEGGGRYKKILKKMFPCIFKKKYISLFFLYFYKMFIKFLNF